MLLKNTDLAKKFDWNYRKWISGVRVSGLSCDPSGHRAAVLRQPDWPVRYIFSSSFIHSLMNGFLWDLSLPLAGLSH